MASLNDRMYLIHMNGDNMENEEHFLGIFEFQADINRRKFIKYSKISLPLYKSYTFTIYKYLSWMSDILTREVSLHQDATLVRFAQIPSAF